MILLFSIIYFRQAIMTETCVTMAMKGCEGDVKEQIGSYFSTVLYVMDDFCKPPPTPDTSLMCELPEDENERCQIDKASFCLIPLYKSMMAAERNWEEICPYGHFILCNIYMFSKIPHRHA